VHRSDLHQHTVHGLGKAVTTVAGVPQPADPVGEQLDGVPRLHVLGQHHDAGTGMRGADTFGRLDPLGRVRRRHPDVGEHRIRPELLDRVEQRVGVFDQPDHVHLGHLGEQGRRTLPDEEVVLGEYHPQRTLTRCHARTLARGWFPERHQLTLRAAEPNVGNSERSNLSSLGRRCGCRKFGQEPWPAGLCTGPRQLSPAFEHVQWIKADPLNVFRFADQLAIERQRSGRSVAVAEFSAPTGIIA
jgi:hypothetical protein